MVPGFGIGVHPAEFIAGLVRMAGDSGAEFSEGVNSQTIDKPNGRRMPYGPVFQGKSLVFPTGSLLFCGPGSNSAGAPGRSFLLNLYFKLDDRWM
jgi:hypothetical protein